MSETQLGPDFDALFADELEPVIVPFQVQGRDCTVTLKPMDSRDLTRFEAMAAGVQAGDEAAMERVTSFLVSRTVADYHLWHRPRLKDGELGDWQQLNAPQHDEQRRQAVEKHLRFSAAFWRWLCERCAEVNAVTEGQQGN